MGLLADGARTLLILADLVLPVGCAGCREPPERSGLCRGCAELLTEPPGPARPSPSPAGLPTCLTGGDYGGARRELILAYKERGRRGLAVPLGDALAGVVRAGWPPGRSTPLVLVPVPATAAATRARYGDHMLALARRAMVRLNRDGYRSMVVCPVRALPKPDSAHLDRQARADAARHAFALRSGWAIAPGGRRAASRAGLASHRTAGRVAAERAEALRAADAGGVVLLDDVLTTGVTLAAVSAQLSGAGLPVAFAATLAAARLRGGNGRTERWTGSNVGGDGMASKV
jgi:predicted amidophosphoribosyltransferase